MTAQQQGRINYFYLPILRICVNLSVVDLTKYTSNTICTWHFTNLSLNIDFRNLDIGNHTLYLSNLTCFLAVHVYDLHMC